MKEKIVKKEESSNPKRSLFFPLTFMQRSTVNDSLARSSPPVFEFLRLPSVNAT